MAIYYLYEDKSLAGIEVSPYEPERVRALRFDYDSVVVHRSSTQKPKMYMRLPRGRQTGSVAPYGYDWRKARGQYPRSDVKE